MTILYKHAKEETVRHTFTINQGGELNIQFGGTNATVTIIFKNRKFDSVDCETDAQCINNERSFWWVRGAIAEKIKELEDYYNAPSVA